MRRLEYCRRVNTAFKCSVELAVCANDIAHWVNHWVWTYDPREEVATLPFNLFPRQAELLVWLQEREAAGEGGLVEKSRDMGLTWLCGAYAVHGWLFRDGFAAGFGSRKVDLVDRIGDPDSIFEKLRFLYRNLPAWMLPQGFTPKDHDGFLKLLNPANGASITGEGGDNIGRGGRKSLYFVDESAYLEHPQTVEASLSQTTRVRIDVSTPNGPGNAFYQRRFSGKIPVFTFHWSQDPRKGEAWYAKERERLDPVTLAQEVDIDYTASIEGICIPAKWVRAAVDLPIPASGDRRAGFDVAEEGRNRSVLIARTGPVVTSILDWGQLNTTQTAWKARDEAAALAVPVVNYDCIGVGAGVKGTWDSAETPLPFQANAVNVGEAPTEELWPNGKTAREQFLNLKAELWWKVRRRFEKAYEHRLFLNGEDGGKQHPPDECISIPDHSGLIADLSLPLYQRTETGKIKIEPKESLARRGVKSPDFAEALILSEYAAAPTTMESDPALFARWFPSEY